jgi:hypothetical protein
MRRRYRGLMALLVCLCSCAGPVWTKLDASDEQLQREWVECRAQATQGSYNAYMRGVSASTQRDLMWLCLKGHGWTKLTKQEADQLGLHPIQP